MAVIVTGANVDRFVDRVAALGTLRAYETVDLSATVMDTVTVIHFCRRSAGTRG